MTRKEKQLANLEEEFFSKPVLPDDFEPTDARGAAARESIEQAFVAARRARFARYVTLATLTAALLCFAAFVR